MIKSKSQNTSNSAQIDPKILSRYVKKIGFPLGFLVLLLGVISLVGYVFNIEILYRPITDGPATSPLTATVIILISICIVFVHYGARRVFPIFVALTAIFFCLLHLGDLFRNTEYAYLIMPFAETVSEELLAGKHNVMGINTTLMLLLLALSSLFYVFQYPRTSQLFAFTSLCFPTVALTGYAYDVTNLYGEMSLLSTLFGVLLCLSCLAITADKGGLQAILSPFVGGKIARVQILLGFFVPFVVGDLMVRFMIDEEDNGAFGIYAVVICWFIILLVVTSAIFQEMLDAKRRNAELALRRSAYIDDLTMISNRRSFMERVPKVLAKARKEGAKSWLMLLDIDFFKKVNDTAGHGMGNQVLIQVAEILQEKTLPPDVVCRLGGEEFCIFIYRASQVEALDKAEQIREAIEKMEVEGYTDRHGQITISIGCAPVTDISIDQILPRADKALYKSKHEGRNRVTLAEV